MGVPLQVLSSHRLVQTGDLVVAWCGNPEGHQQDGCGWDRGPTAWPLQRDESPDQQEQRVVAMLVADATEMQRARAPRSDPERQAVDLAARLGG